MAFSSYIYILAFLPAACIIFWILQRRSLNLALGWLIVASVLFYAAWNPRDVLIAGVSFAGNFIAAWIILNRRRPSLALGLAVAANLLALGYFKYASAVLGVFDPALAKAVHTELPLGISFFTFTQIAYLADCHARKIRPRQHSWRDYLTFVSFFPHLIAGPILHHANIIPQFHGAFRQDRARKAGAGVVLFAIGLSKKVLIADALGRIANPIFNGADHGVLAGLQHSWLGAVAYMLQIYFDFSGYSDMAVASALFLGVSMPFNFNSPYKSASIIDFWRRWHITLSSFLRDYLYFPLGGNRLGEARRYLNVFIVMLLGGIWHGAGLTFVIWGALHGLFIVINHLWRDFAGPKMEAMTRHRLWRPAAYILTMACVLVGWVFFRAQTVHGAISMLGQMAGAHPLSEGALGPRDLMLVGAAGLIAGFAPNSWRIHDRLLSAGALRWGLIGAASGAAFTVALVCISADSPFLYFQF